MVASRFWCLWAFVTKLISGREVDSSDIAAERIAFFTSNQKRETSIHNEANRPPPTSYATAAVPQKQKQTKVSQARPKPVQNQNDNQIPREQFATMCTSVSSLCKQTCDTIKQQQPILAANLTQLEEQRQETKLARQETKLARQENKLIRQENKLPNNK